MQLSWGTRQSLHYRNAWAVKARKVTAGIFNVGVRRGRCAIPLSLPGLLGGRAVGQFQAVQVVILHVPQPGRYAASEVIALQVQVFQVIQ